MYGRTEEMYNFIKLLIILSLFFTLLQYPLIFISFLILLIFYTCIRYYLCDIIEEKNISKFNR